MKNDLMTIPDTVLNHFEEHVATKADLTTVHKILQHNHKIFQHQP